MSVEGWNQKPSALAQPDCSAAFDRVAKQSVLSGQVDTWMVAGDFGTSCGHRDRAVVVFV